MMQVKSANTVVRNRGGYVTLYFDVMRGGRFVFTLPYKHCKAFKLNEQMIRDKVLELRPSLRKTGFEIFKTETPVLT